MQELTDKHNGQSSRTNHHSVNSNLEQEIEVSNMDKHAVVDTEILPRINKEGSVLLEWKSVSSYVQSAAVKKKNSFVKLVQHLWYNESQKSDEKQRQLKEMKQVLHSVCGYAQSGDTTALMGPSGSGKTTLLSILGYRAPKAMTHTGRVTYNGIPVNKTIRRLVGYVLQDDLLYPNLTVYETLYYAAMLKLPRTMSKVEKLGRVEAVILALGLEKCRNTLIGNEERRGVSGGERKRVSIGYELLTNPSVLILDEPTSGLDSTIAMKLVSSLRVLADGGRVVLMTIHQPSSRLYQQLSRLILLSEGRTMYSGQSKSAAGWFEEHGFSLPAGIHIADFILDLANGNVEGNGMDAESARLYLIECMDKNQVGDYYGSIKNNMEKLNGQEDYEARMESSRKALLKSASKSKVWGSPFLQQVCILLSRSTKNRRFDCFTYCSFFRICALAVLTSAFWWQQGDENTLLAATDVSAAIFYILVQILFDLLLNALDTFPDTLNYLKKERASGMYRLSAFYISESICAVPLDYSLPLIHMIVAYWCLHLRQSLLAFFSMICATILASLAVQAMGLFIGVVAVSQKNATAFGVVVLIGMMLVGGFLVKDLPGWLSWVPYLSIPYWAFRLGMQIHFHNRSYIDCGGVSGDQLPLEECTDIEDLGEELNVPFDVDGPKWPAILALVLMFFIFRVATYFFLNARTRT